MKRLCLALLLAAFIALVFSQKGNHPFAGRWDLTVTTTTSTYPSWMEFAEKIAKAEIDLRALLTTLSADNSSDQRFQRAADALNTLPKATKEQPKANLWAAKDKSVSVNVKSTATKSVVTYEAKDGPTFAAYVTGRLDDLYEAFRQSQKTSTGD